MHGHFTLHNISSCRQNIFTSWKCFRGLRSAKPSKPCILIAVWSSHYDPTLLLAKVASSFWSLCMFYRIKLNVGIQTGSIATFEGYYIRQPVNAKRIKSILSILDALCGTVERYVANNVWMWIIHRRSQSRKVMPCDPVELFTSHCIHCNLTILTI